MSKPLPDPDLVARILVDATAHGVKEAALRHGLNPRTITRYRRRCEQDRTLSDKVASLKRALADAWLLDAQVVRASMVENLRARAATSKNLRSVAGAFKIIHDAILAEEITARVRKPRASAGLGGILPPGREAGAPAPRDAAH